MKISPKSIEVSGFPQWVNFAVIIGAILFFAATAFFARRVVVNSARFIPHMIVAGIVLLVLLFFVGRIYDRWGTSSDISAKVQKAKQDSRTEQPPAPPLAAGNLTASPVSASQINLSWADSSDSEEGFKIERKLGVEGTYAPLVILGPNSTTFSDVGLAPEVTASYRIKAFNANGESSYSNDATATTSGTAPKCNDNTWSNPSSWFWYVIFPVLLMAVFLCVWISYLLFRHFRMRRWELRHREMDRL